MGDSAVLIPISAAILAWLLAMRSFAGALWWVAVVVLCASLTALLKVYFIACPVGQEITSPSGHTSFSTLVFGALGLFIAAECHSRRQRLIVACLAAALIAAVAVSRLVLGAHSPLEVAMGLLVGLTALAVFARAYARHKPVRGVLAPLLSGVVLILLLLHGHELRAEQLFGDLGRYLGLEYFCF